MMYRVDRDNQVSKTREVMNKKNELGQLNPVYQKMIIDFIDRYVPQGKVILFGSRATGTARQGSDIDIAIDAGQKITDGSIGRLRLAIEEELNVPIKVDLSDFYDLPESFQKVVREKGILWRS